MITRLRRCLARLRRDRRGATAVEFAVVGTSFLLLSLGSIEFGRLVWTREALQAAAISGARCMGVLSNSCASGATVSTSSTTTYVIATAQGWNVTVPAKDVAVNATASCAGIASESDFSSVTITYTFQTVLPKLIPALAQGLTLTAAACFPNQPVS